MRPGLGIQHGAAHRHRCKPVGTGALDGVAAVELAEHAPVRVKGDAEVRAHLVQRVGERAVRVVRQARNDGLLLARSVRTDPRLNRELAQHRVILANRTAEGSRIGCRRRVRAREVHRLTAVGVVPVARIRGACHGMRELLSVRQPVVVGVEALVLLEGEHVFGHAAFGRKVIHDIPKPEVLRQVGNAHRRRHDRVAAVVLGREARLGGGVRHPERRRVGMVVLRRRRVDEQRLLRVAQAVAVRIGLGHAHEPRVFHRVVDGFRHRRHRRPAHPGVVVGREEDSVIGHPIRIADHVAPAKQRVEAVEDFVVVVHAVVVRVPEARVGGGIRICGDAILLAGRGVWRESGGAQHHAVPRLFVVRADVDADLILGHHVPRLGRSDEVAEVTIAESLAAIRGETGEARRARGLEERGAVPCLHGQEAHVGARAGQPVGQVAAHERGLRVVVAEMAERLDEVLLEVLEAVVVEVEVAHGARAGIDRARRRIADDGASLSVPRSEGAVHAGRDVVGFSAPEDAVIAVDGRQLTRRQAELIRRSALEHNTCEVTLPRIRQQVAVRIDRAGVQAAAADAQNPPLVIRRVSVDEREGVPSRVIAKLEGRLPGNAFIPIRDAVAVGVDVPRIGREELVEPAALVARVVLVDRHLAEAVGGMFVCIAGVRAGVFGRMRKEVSVHLEIPVLFVVRVEHDIELPAVGHAVFIRVRAMVRARVGGNRRALLRRFSLPLAAGRRAGHGVGDFLERHVRVRGPGLKHAGNRQLVGGNLCKVAGKRPNRLALVGRLRIVAVLQDEVLVKVGIGTCVDREARLANVRRVVRIQVWIPAVAHVAVDVHAPGRARVKPELRVDLVMDEAQGLVRFKGDERQLGNVNLLRVERLGRGDADVTFYPPSEFPARFAQITDGLVLAIRTAADGRIVGFLVAVAVHGDGGDAGEAALLRIISRIISRNRVVVVLIIILAIALIAALELAEDAFPVGGQGVKHGRTICRGKLGDGVRLLSREGRHVVAVEVRLPLGRIGRLQGVLAAHDLPEVAHAVAVGVPVHGVCAEGKFLEVRQAVVVRVALREVVLAAGRRHGGVERGGDVVRGDRHALRDVRELELLALKALPLALVIDPADCCPIPEEVLEAVREAIAVRIVHRRVGAVLGNPGVLLVQALVPVRDMLRVRRIERPCEFVDVELLVHVHDRVRLGRRERRIGDPRAADVVVEAVRAHAVVEPLMESADFPFRLERLPHA